MGLSSPSGGTGVLFGSIIFIAGVFTGSFATMGAGVFWIILGYLLSDD